MKALGSFLFFFALTAFADFQVPAFSAPVVDQANLISPSTRARLNQELDQIFRSGGSQVAVLTVLDLGGEPIEQASIKVVDQWKLGTKEKDNGVLLLISKNDRQMRLEVGQGLEGDLTDAHSKRIIEDVIFPYFRNGQFEDGIVAGIQAIFSRTDPNLKSNLPETSWSSQVNAEEFKKIGGIAGLVLFLMFKFPVLFFIVLLFIILRARHPRNRRFYRGGGWGGGSGWGGGGFGGGFGGGGFGGGGGGGFSGGGASGRW